MSSSRPALGDFTVTPRMLRIAALAVPVGAVSACVAWALLRLIGLFTNLFFYQRVDTRLIAPGQIPHNPALVLLAPVAGGLVVGLMARFGSERIRGHGMPEAIEAILTGGSKVQPRVALLKPVSAAISIGSGGPFGAEGPIIMTGGAVGSIMAQFLRLTADERKTLLVSGATAGMAATFNAPLASLLLAVELLLFEWRPRSFVPVGVAVSVATVVRGPILGTGRVFAVPTSAVHLGAVDWGLVVVAALAAAALAAVLTALVYAAEDVFHRLPIHWMWWPPIGGLVIGLGGLVQPRALGVGYDVIHAALLGHLTLSVVVGVLVVKSLIWSLSLGSGTSGGVLAPLLMMGATLGALEAHVFPHVGPGFWTIVSVGAILAAAMRVPLTGIVFALELTGAFPLVLPLVVAATIAYAASALVLKRSILTEKVARRGFHLTREYDVDPLEVLFVREVMSTDVISFRAGTPIDELVNDFLDRRRQPYGPRHDQRLYPVLDDDDRLVGVVTRRLLVDRALGTAGDRRPLRDLVVAPLVAYPDETLRSVAYRMAEHGVTRLAVVRREDEHDLVGVVSLAQLLAGRLRDLEEARQAERLLRVRMLFPSGPGRLRTEHTTVVEGADADAEPDAAEPSYDDLADDVSAPLRVRTPHAGPRTSRTPRSRDGRTARASSRPRP